MGKRYSQNEVEYIKENISKISFVDMSKKMNRPYSALKEFCRKNNIYNKTLQNNYVIKEDTAFIELYDKNKDVVENFMVDIEDLEIIKKYRWSMNPQKYIINKKSGISIHRLLTNCPNDMVVDHINHNTLDNRRKNLRIVSRAENCRNRCVKNYYKTENNNFNVKFSDINFGNFYSKSEAIMVSNFAKTILYPTSPEYINKNEILKNTPMYIVNLVKEKIEQKILFLNTSLSRINGGAY